MKQTEESVSSMALDRGFRAIRDAKPGMWKILDGFIIHGPFSDAQAREFLLANPGLYTDTHDGVQGC